MSFFGNHQLQDLKVPAYTHTKTWWVFAVYIPEWSRFNCTILLPVFAFMSLGSASGTRASVANVLASHHGS